MIVINMSQIARVPYTQDHVKLLEVIYANQGRFTSLDYRPYIDMLTAYGVQFSAPLGVG